MGHEELGGGSEQGGDESPVLISSGDGHESTCPRWTLGRIDMRMDGRIEGGLVGGRDHGIAAETAHHLEAGVGGVTGGAGGVGADVDHSSFKQRNMDSTRWT